MIKPNCTSPILLFNRYCLTMVQNGGIAHMDGVVSRSIPPSEHLLSVARGLSDDVLDNYFVTLGKFKEPMFLYVPCMSCELCMHSKQVDLINRSILETLTWDCPPMFFTLTYRESCIPCVNINGKRYSVGELRYKDFQDFMKRLRMRWTRKGLKHDVRYLCAGEYGTRYGRCHMHVILWNNPYGCSELDRVLFEDLRDDIFYSWGLCDWKGFDFGQCRGGAAPYATKYVTKPQVTHGHVNKPFIRCSSGRRGGLGSIFLQKYVDYLRENPQLNYLDYMDRDCKYNYMFFSKSIIRKVWPSPTSCVNGRLRDDFLQFCDCLSKMVYLRLMSYDDAVNIAHQLRPSKYVRVNVERPKFLSTQCPLFLSYFKGVLERTFAELSDRLSVCVDESELDDYVSLYYARRERLPILIRPDSAPKVAKLREQIAKQQAKEVF